VTHTAVANDFAAFFRAHPRIRHVFFNGQKAEGLFERHVLPGLGPEFAGIHFECLPSTSPAHAGMTFAKKLDRWKRIKETTT
jgi:hypoxanthine-DNA glycosylase